MTKLLYFPCIHLFIVYNIALDRDLTFNNAGKNF